MQHNWFLSHTILHSPPLHVSLIPSTCLAKLQPGQGQAEREGEKEREGEVVEGREEWTTDGDACSPSIPVVNWMCFFQ